MTAAPIDPPLTARPATEPPEQAPQVLRTSRVNQLCPHCRQPAVLLIGGIDIPVMGECSNCGHTPTPRLVRAAAKMRKGRR